MDEFQLISFIKKFFKSNLIGDDTAFINNSKINLISKDILIEDVHFKINNNLFEIGEKSLISNISDILASGGIGKYFFLGLGIPDYFKETDIKNFLKGLKKISKKYNVNLAGGDISTSSKFFISITITGKTILNTPITRNNAKEGDNIYIVGNLGDSEIGLKIILGQIKIDKENLKNYFIKKHYVQKLYPEFLKELLLHCKINSMIDISDGFLQDLSHILIKSKKSAKIFGKKIPKSNNYKKLKNILNSSFYTIPLISGEEYSLIFTSSENFHKIKSIANKFKVKITKVGEITSLNSDLIIFLDMFEKFDKIGYKHFF